MLQRRPLRDAWHDDIASCATNLPAETELLDEAIGNPAAGLRDIGLSRYRRAGSQYDLHRRAVLRLRRVADLQRTELQLQRVPRSREARSRWEPTPGHA